MKLVKSLLLGSAAGLMAVTGSMAADLPSRKAAPADFVRVCSAQGTGFFFIPGTETCLRISGRVRAEYLVGERAVNNGVPGVLNVAGQGGEDAYGFRARARINLDARTQTPFGTLRTFLRMDVTTNTGQYNTATDQSVTGLNLDKAFIQFAGITAGRAQSFFDFYAAEYNYGAIRGTDGANTNLLAYTASFGGGFSATISLEDGASKNNGQIATIRGRDYPDVVGVLRLDQSWGSAQLMGALHQVQTTAAIGLNPVVTSDKTGYAIGAGVKVNLPMLAAGSNLFLEGVYAKGAVSYTSTGIGNTRTGELNYQIADAVLTQNALGAVTGTRLTESYSIVGGILHFWTPQIRQSLYASYFSYNPGNTAVFSTLAAGSTGNKFSEYRIGTNLIWSPVAGLDIGVEVLYINGDPRRNQQSVKNTSVFKGQDDTYQARLRIQRDF